MIEFYRTDQEDSFSDQVEETFEELVLAHKVHRVPKNETDGTDEDQPLLPRIEDDEGIYEGEEQIKEYLEQLRMDLKSMRAYTSDACYIDPESGDIC